MSRASSRETLGVMHQSSVPPPSARDLLEEARRLGLRAFYMRPQELAACVSGEEPSLIRRGELLRLDVLLVRGLGHPLSVEQLAYRLSLLRHIELQGTLVTNSSLSIELARNKFLALLKLREAGVPVPPTLITESLPLALRFVEKWGSVVVKPVIGSMGRGVILLRDPDIAYAVFRQLLTWSQPLMLQKYYEKIGNRDLRVLVINGEPYVAYYRVAREGSFKTNVAQGAKIEPAGSSFGDSGELAIRAAKALGLFYAGVDIMETSEGSFVLEVNASPNWKGAKILGYNPAAKLIEELIKARRR